MTATTICNFSFERFSIKKAFLKIAMLLFWSVAVFAQSTKNTSGQNATSAWVLAAEKFSVEQSSFDSYSLDKEAEMIPQIILEQLSQNFSRLIPYEEIYNRKQNQLLVSRLALFLQLSKEVKARDALVVTQVNSRKLKKEIAAAEKKIDEIKKQIAENLEEVKKLEEEEAEEAKKSEELLPPPSAFFRIFRKKDRKENKTSFENVELYKSDSLFSVSEEIRKEGYESYSFGEAVKKENISGLLTGVIKPYGEYASVRVDLRVFPSGEVIASVTEIGLLTDLLQLAKNLSRSLSPKLSNSMPIRVKLEIEPESAIANTVVTLDDVVFPEFKDEILLDSGIHTFTIEANGYNKETFSYNFENKSDFRVSVKLQEKSEGKIGVYLKKSLEGTFYANSLYAGSVDDTNRTAYVKINGKNIIGQFTIEVDDGDDENGEKKSLSSYFFIPANKVEDGDYIYFNTKPIDLEYYIDKSRKRMYTGYTLLVLSLPFSFYTYGKYIEARNAYKLNYTSDIDEVNKWQKYSLYSFGVSAAFGANWIVQLVRYIHTASKVLPANAKKGNKAVENREDVSDNIEIDGIIKEKE